MKLLNKRIISLLLAMVMLCGMMPMTAFAAEEAESVCDHTYNNGICTGCGAEKPEIPYPVFQNDLAGIVNGAADCGQLYQTIGAVTAFLHHPFDLIHMANGPGKTVHNCLLIFMHMAVIVRKAVGMHVGVIVDIPHGTPSFYVFLASL